MKVLVVRFSSIGDIVLTSPVVRALKRQLGAEVHFLSKKAFSPVLAHNPYIDKMHLIDKRVGALLPALRAERFDAIVDLHGNLRSARVKWGLWSSPSDTFHKLNWQKRLLTRFKIDLMPPVHIVDRYLAAVAFLGVVNDGQGLDYFIAPEEEVVPATLHPSLNPYEYTALVIGAAHATKRLPEARLIELCQRLIGPVALLGGPDDAHVGARVAAAAGPQVINTCGQLKLNQSASLVRQSARVITHDTGLMHIAAAFQKPIFSIWGNTTPKFGMYPYYPQDIQRNTSIEVASLGCRPCSRIGYDACPKGHFRCMNNLSFDAIPAHIHPDVKKL